VIALVGASHFVNHAYFMLLPPIFGPPGRELALTDSQLGLALGTLGVVVTALQLPFGHLSDSHSRSLVLGISLAFGAVGAMLTAMAQSFPALLGAQVVLGIGIAGHHPSHYPLLSAATSDATRGRAYSVHGFTGALGFAAPPALIGVTATLGIDWRVAVAGIAVAGGLFGLVALVVVRRYLSRRITHPPARRPAGDHAADSPPPGPVASDADSTRRWGRLSAVADALVRAVRSLRNSPAILALTVLWFVTSTAGWGIKQYTAVLLSGPYGVGAATANLVVSAMLATGAVLIFAGGWLTDRYTAVVVLLGGYAALVVAAGALGWGVLPVGVAIAVTLLLSATVDASRPARAALADRFSQGTQLGKNFGLLTIGISGGAAVAPPVFGALVERLGVRPVFLVIAGVGCLALALTVVVVSLGEAAETPAP
jgi:MFS family permease